MEIVTEASEHGARMAVAGDMSIYHAAEMKQEFLKAAAEHAELEIDLAQVSELDTAGFQILVVTKREAQKHGHTLRFVGHSQPVRDVLELYRYESSFGDPVVIPAA